MIRTSHLGSKMFYGWRERRLNNNHVASAICTSYEIDGRFSWKDGAAKGRIQWVSDDEFWIRCFALFGLLIEMIKVIAFWWDHSWTEWFLFHLPFHSEQSFGSIQVWQNDIAPLCQPEFVWVRLAVVCFCVVFNGGHAVFICKCFRAYIHSLRNRIVNMELKQTDAFDEHFPVKGMCQKLRSLYFCKCQGA